MSITERKSQLRLQLAETRERKHQLMNSLEQTKTTEQQILGAIAILDELESERIDTSAPSDGAKKNDSEASAGG